MSKESLPPVWHLYLLDVVLAKVQVSLVDESESTASDTASVSTTNTAYVQDLLPHVIRLTQAILHCTR